MSRGELLREVMLQTGITQTELSRVSGVHQPSISMLLSGQIEASDDHLNRLLACMGYQVMVVRRPVMVELTRSERRSWRLHRAVSARLDRETLAEWSPRLSSNITRRRQSIQGQPHERNLDRWKHMIDTRDVAGLHRALTGLDRESIEMREVSPMAGILSERERIEASMAN